jgi:hypothetical protein
LRILACVVVPLAAAADSKLAVRVLTPTPATYERIEFAIAPDRVPDNPFDPNQADLRAVVTTPSGRRLVVPGFWFQDYRRSIRNPEAQGVERIEVLDPVGPPEWRVRFSSGEVGPHRFTFELHESGNVRRPGEYTVTLRRGAGRGYIRISPRNRNYLEDATGRTFFPIGENLCMYERKEGTYYYDRLLDKLAKAGANYVRLWQEYYVSNNPNAPSAPGDAGFTGFPLETTVTGLGRYDLASAWRLDTVANACERLDMYWQIASEMVVWWERKLAYRWQRNPYNAVNGGPCEKPADYFTNTRARELVRRRLRYNVARWGWASHLAAWELWNEVDNLDGFDPAANADWHREMGGYLKEIDPWRHLVTTSWRDRRMFALPQIDIVQGHSYFGPEYDAAQYSLQDTDHLMRGFGKPFFFGEQGIEGPVSVDPEGKHFHDTIWATALSGAAGTGLYWWWHNYIEPYNLYRHYKPLAQFVRGIDFAAHEWKAPALSRPNLPVTLNVYGLVAPDRALLWIHDPLAFRITGGKAVRGPDQSGASANVVGLGEGLYDVEWWSTTTGEIVARDSRDVRPLRHFGYGIELNVPEFWGDVAARIIRHGAGW